MRDGKQSRITDVFRCWPKAGSDDEWLVVACGFFSLSGSSKQGGCPSHSASSGIRWLRVRCEPNLMLRMRTRGPLSVSSRDELGV